MADKVLEYGVRVKVTDLGLTVQDCGAVTAARRLEAAIQQLREAWEGVPPGLRQRLVPMVVELRDDDGPTVGVRVRQG
jgi:hypothetical protein